MADVDIASTITSGMSDPEFSREMRFFTGAMKIGVGDRMTVATFDDGKLVGVVDQDVPDDQCKIVVRGTQDHWDHLLAEKPVPFYQCLQTTTVKHGMYMSTTNETFAYLPALNRLTQLLRAAANGKAA